MILVEDNDPPPFGLITLGALSPCLFTLQQQLGHEGVNEASSPSTASIKAPARELRSLLGSCKSASLADVKGAQHGVLGVACVRTSRGGQGQMRRYRDGPGYVIIVAKVYL